MKSHLTSSVTSDTMSCRSSTGSISTQCLIEQFQSHACKSHIEVFLKVGFVVNCTCAKDQTSCLEQSSEQDRSFLGRLLGSRLSKRGLVLLSAGSLEASAPWHLTGIEPSELVQAMASLVPQDTYLHMPLGCLLNSLYPPHAGTELLSFLPAVSLIPCPAMLPYAPSADAITRMDYDVLKALRLLRPLISCHGEALHLAAAFWQCPKPGIWPAGRSGEKSSTHPGLQSSWLSPKVFCADSWGQTPPPAGCWHPRN